MTLDKYCIECGFEYRLEFNDDFDKNEGMEGFPYCPDCGAKSDWGDDEVE